MLTPYGMRLLSLFINYNEFLPRHDLPLDAVKNIKKLIHKELFLKLMKSSYFLLYCNCLKLCNKYNICFICTYIHKLINIYIYIYYKMPICLHNLLHNNSKVHLSSSDEKVDDPPHNFAWKECGLNL